MKIIFLKIRKSIVNSLITQLYLNVCAFFLCTFTHSKRLRCVKIHSCTAWWSCGGSNATTWMGFWVIQLLPQCTLFFWHSSEILLGLESLSLFSSLSNLCVWFEFGACREYFFYKEKTACISNTSVQQHNSMYSTVLRTQINVSLFLDARRISQNTLPSPFGQSRSLRFTTPIYT